MPSIAQVHAREVLDSRGRPTLEVVVTCSDGTRGTAIVPSGASTGRAEACELRDGDPHRYDGLGVLRAAAHVRDILGLALQGYDPSQQAAIDARLQELDGTPQKSRLGANALLGVSLAAAHAAAAAQGIPLYAHLHRLWCETLDRAAASTAGGPAIAHGGQHTGVNTSAAVAAAPRLPVPMVNMISGGLHAGGQLEFQDFLLLPHAAPDYPTALRWIVTTYRRLGKLLADQGYEHRLVADEGGYGPHLPDHATACALVVHALEAAGLRPGVDASLAIDVASTHFFRDGRYHLRDAARRDRTGRGNAASDAQPPGLTTDEMIDYVERLARAFPVASLEDPLAEDDWDGWARLTARLGSRMLLVGDDLFATNPVRLQRGIACRAANAVLIKPNQIGTLSETLDTMRLARTAAMTCIVSARSGETEDTTIADLAVATAAPYIKIGSVTRGERLAKYNRLLRIAEELAAPDAAGRSRPPA
jgi:enolase